VGLAWGEHGLVAIQLPEATPEATRRRLRRRCPEVPADSGGQGVKPGEAVSNKVPADSLAALPAPMARAIKALTALLAGQRADLGDVPLDLAGLPDFDRRVYEIARAIPPGETLTYGAIAQRLGQPGAAREVGAALGRNPFPLVVPCHRVVAAGGKLGGFSAAQGTVTKRRLLEIEGALPPPLPLF
jgi:methylated-DNA-[protein]-cysteine S-methyltransferase